ncbi:MAG: hypothetical protein GKS00_13660 [Alphaproteobacteria bacterium]|nr:hypothetical protein [Alphaproteobacteria bacterium]
MQQAAESPVGYGTQNSSGSDQQTGALWAEAQTDWLTALRPSLEKFENKLDQATMDLHQTEIDAAGALLKAVNAEATVTDARNALNGVNMELRIAKSELKTLKALPVSQENATDIDDLEIEVAALQIILEGVKGDLMQADEELTTARFSAADAETAIARAENVVGRAVTAKEQVQSQIARYEAESFDATQGGKSAFEIVSGPDPRDVAAQPCANGTTKDLSQGVRRNKGNNS